MVNQLLCAARSEGFLGPKVYQTQAHEHFGDALAVVRSDAIEQHVLDRFPRRRALGRAERGRSLVSSDVTRKEIAHRAGKLSPGCVLPLEIAITAQATVENVDHQNGVDDEHTNREYQNNQDQLINVIKHSYLNFRVPGTHCRPGKIFSETKIARSKKEGGWTEHVLWPSPGQAMSRPSLKNCGPQRENSGLKIFAPLPSLRSRSTTPHVHTWKMNDLVVLK